MKVQKPLSYELEIVGKSWQCELVYLAPDEVWAQLESEKQIRRVRH